MKDSDLIISNRDDVYTARVTGRANFEYAVPLRELAKTVASFAGFKIDLAECTAMDSTFMGVLSMLGLKARSFKVTIELFNTADSVRKSLSDLGIAKLFEFKCGSTESSEPDGSAPRAAADMLTLAETVAEAHQVLAETDDANVQRFGDVIKLAEADVERLRRERGTEAK